MLDYRISTFLSLAETLNYTKTAKKCNISQPAVTQQIKSLQNDLATELVNYHNRQLTLTTSGQYLADELQKLVPKLNEIKQHITKIEDKIHLGCGKTIGEFVLFRKDFSLKEVLEDTRIELSVDTTYYLLKKLDEHELDMAIVAGIFDHSKYIVVPYIKEKLIPICSPQNISAKKATTLADLRHQSLFLREQGSGVYDIMMALFQQKQIVLEQFRNMNEISNINVIKNLVIQDKGISFLFETSISDNLRDGTLCEIPLVEKEEIDDIYFYIVIRKESRHNPKIKKIMTNLIQTAK